MVIAAILAIFIGLAQYFREPFSKLESRYHDHLLSFSAGVSTTYIFLHLFPQFSAGATSISRFLFISVLIGFVFFHVVEKYIYQHSPKDKLMRELALEDSVISFIYHLVIGIILVSFINQGLGQGILFFIPVFLYTAVSTLPVDISQSKIINLVVSSSTFLGVLIGGGFYQNAHPIVYLALLGFIIGALSFTVFRHSIPQGSKGKPLLFTIGVILYAIVIFLL